jgi:hypothetical protein
MEIATENSDLILFAHVYVEKVVKSLSVKFSIEISVRDLKQLAI